MGTGANQVQGFGGPKHETLLLVLHVLVMVLRLWQTCSVRLHVVFELCKYINKSGTMPPDPLILLQIEAAGIRDRAVMHLHPFVQIPVGA